MDRVRIISAVAFMAADLMAIASLVSPNWVSTNSGGHQLLGLTSQCVVIHGRAESCTAPGLTAEWMTTLVFIAASLLCLKLACGFLLASHWRENLMKYARWTAFVAMILLCLANLIFPLGFYSEDIGGEPYKLPSHMNLGVAYVLFVISTFLTVMAEFTVLHCTWILFTRQH